MAFHHNCPNHFLSPETVRALHQDLSVSSSGSQKALQKPYILGRIVEMTLNEVSVSDSVGNPFGLPLGTLYHTVNVEQLSFTDSSILANSGTTKGRKLSK